MLKKNIHSRNRGEIMSIRELDNGNYQVRVSYKDIHGNYRQATKVFDRITAARNWQDEVRVNQRKGSNLSTRKVSFTDRFQKYIDLYKTDGSNPHTTEVWKFNLNHIKTYFHDTQLNEITHDNWQEFMNEFGRTHALATAQKLNGEAKAVVQDAINNGMIHLNFIDNTNVTGKPSMKEQDKYLEYDEYEVLYKYLINHADYEHNTQAQALFQLSTGLRFGEYMGAQKQFIDFEHNLYQVRHQYSSSQKTLTATKGNGRADGDVPFSKGFAYWLKDYLKDQEIMLLKKHIDNPDNFIFFNKNGNLSANGVVNDEYTKLVQSVGINRKRTTTHAMRHTYASVLLADGIDPMVVMRRLRHTDIKTLWENYAHLMQPKYESENLKALKKQNSYFLE